MSGIKVTWEDQQRINTYGRLTGRRREIEAELLELDEGQQEKNSTYKMSFPLLFSLFIWLVCCVSTEIKTLEDASSEITLNDEGLMFRMADCFVVMDGADEAETLLAQQAAAARNKQKALANENAAAKATLAELKVELVRHFGDAIALDKN